jgi:dTDP-4-amino-4,6-dideoxygalactose transaminase
MRKFSVWPGKPEGATPETRSTAVSANAVSPRSSAGYSKPSFVPFALPDIGPDEIAEVVDTLRSGWITSGPKVRQFEEEFAHFLGAGVECVAVNSATAGLHLALEAVGIQAGDQVIVPTHTFTATAEVVRYLGADPVFVDINAETYCLDPARVEAAVTPRTKAIVPVHFGGLPAEMTAILGIAARHGLRVVEDAAHAFSTVYRGALIGTLDSSATVFSFHATKTLTTGEGGMLVTQNRTVAQRARIMRMHGIDRDAFSRIIAPVHTWRYEVVAPGFKYNLTDIAAAIGIAQLRRTDALLARREELARRYTRLLSGLPLILPSTPNSGSRHAWHLYVAQLSDDTRITRDHVLSYLYEAGIGCSVHYIPLHLQPYWRDRYKLRPEDFPNSQRVFEREISLPLHTKMTDADQDRVIDALHQVLQG